MTDSSPPTDDIVRRLMHSPRLPQIAHELDMLLREEQARRERFYAELSEQQKVEFINGEVIMQTPAKMRHIAALKRLLSLLDVYVEKHELGFVGQEKVLVTLTRNDYEPDLCFFSREKAQTLTPDQMKFPPPDFVVEILSPSTEDIDRGVKFEDYALHGVGEYWIVDADEETIEQYVLREGVYALAVKVRTGMIQSTAVQGFEIPVRAVFDSAEQLAALQTILRGGMDL